MLKTLQKTIHPEAPVLISKGNVIADGFSKKLDHLRNLLYNSQSELDDMLERESDRTKIPSLKIATSVFASLSEFICHTAGDDDGRINTKTSR